MATATLTWTPPTTRTDGSPLAPDAIAGASAPAAVSDLAAALNP